MFFNSDLQSGIALALQQNKSVVCFARDENEESNRWETEYLKDDEIVHELEAESVTLRLQAGSPEAGFLAAYFPLTIFPSLLIIKNGQLRGKLQAGISLNQFRDGLLEGLKDQETHGPNSMRNNAVLSSSSANIVASEESESGDLAAPETNVTTPVGDGRVYSQQADTSASSTSHQYPIQSSSPQSLSSDVQATLAERRQRLEADQKRREAQALAKRKAKARAQQEEAASKASQDPARAGQLSHAQQQRKRQQEARQERERILKIIENDKVERRHRLELQREYSHAETSKSDTNAQNMSQSAQFQAGTRFSNSAKECALLIRLFDGRSLRSSFPASQNLHTHVRVWVDRERSDGDAPYSFKQVLAPNNNHAIEISEEMESLQALGLVPNATLLMVPAKGASTAYVAGTDRGLATKAAASFSRIGTAVSVFLVSFWLAVTSTLWTYLGIGTRPAPPGHQGGAERASESSVVEEQSDHQAKASGVAITRNVWTLRDQDARKDDQQFYNGNQLNFEPRKDESDDSSK